MASAKTNSEKLIFLKCKGLITVASVGAGVFVEAAEAVEAAGLECLVKEHILRTVDALIWVGPETVIALFAAGLT